MRRLSKKAKSRLTLIVILCLVTCMVFAVISTGGCSLGGISMVNVNESVQTEGVDSVKVDFPSGNLDVRVDANADAIAIIERTSGNAANRSKLRWQVQGGTLSVWYEQSLPMFLFGWIAFGQRQLELVIPESLCANLQDFDVKIASGQCNVRDLTAAHGKIAVSSGTLTGRGLGFEALECDLSSGQLDLADGSFGALALKVSSGKAKLAGKSDSVDAHVSSGLLDLDCADSVPALIRLDVTSGNATLALARDCGFDAAVSKTSGNFTCEFDASQRGETYLYGDGAMPIDVKVLSGNVVLKPNGS